MRYFVTIHGRIIEVELSADGVRVGERLLQAELRDVPGSGVRHLLLDGASIDFVAERTDASGRRWVLQARGSRYDVEVVDERTRAIRELTGPDEVDSGPAPVRAPMPGMITRVEVEVGQDVSAGDGIIVIEAMKMENELRAEAAGTVARVLVGAGEAVEKGAVLVEFQAPDGDGA